MFNYSSEVEWIKVTNIDGGLVWINLATVERIYQTSDGSTFECADTVTRTTVGRRQPMKHDDKVYYHN